MKIINYLDNINKINIPKLQDGEEESIDGFFYNCIKEHLPSKETIYAWDELLNKYITEDKIILFIRKYASDPKKNWNNIRRGFYTKYNNNFGYVYCDNFFAHYFYLMAIKGYIPEYNDFYQTIMDRKFPYGFMETSEEIPFRAFLKGKTVGINKSGWKLAHIFSVNGNVYNFNYKQESKNLFPIGEQKDWVKHSSSDYPYKKIDSEIGIIERDRMKAHFLRLVHPLNYFLVPMHEIDCVNSNIGEYPELIQYVYLYNRIYYPDIFERYEKNIMSDERYRKDTMSEKEDLLKCLEQIGKIKINIKYGFAHKKQKNIGTKQAKFIRVKQNSQKINSRVLDKIDNEELLIIKYLFEGMSYRNIEKDFFGIDSKSRGGGFVVMNKLHELGITREKKGILKNKSIEDEIKIAQDKYLETLSKYKDNLHFKSL